MESSGGGENIFWNLQFAPLLHATRMRERQLSAIAGANAGAWAPRRLAPLAKNEAPDQPALFIYGCWEMISSDTQIV